MGLGPGITGRHPLQIPDVERLVVQRGFFPDNIAIVRVMLGGQEFTEGQVFVNFDPLGRAVDHSVTLKHMIYENTMTVEVLPLTGLVRFHDGDEEIAPGITLHRIGGHTMGLQVMRVWTRRGWVMMASDAAHFYANMEEGRPYPVVFNTAEMLEGFATLRRLASSADHIIPGHDPLVLARYPAPSADLQGIVARLDISPNVA